MIKVLMDEGDFGRVEGSHFVLSEGISFELVRVYELWAH
jgi:hypothetical protein